MSSTCVQAILTIMLLLKSTKVSGITPTPTVSEATVLTKLESTLSKAPLSLQTISATQQTASKSTFSMIILPTPTPTSTILPADNATTENATTENATTDDATTGNVSTDSIEPTSITTDGFELGLLEVGSIAGAGGLVVGVVCTTIVMLAPAIAIARRRKRRDLTPLLFETASSRKTSTTTVPSRRTSAMSTMSTIMEEMGPMTLQMPMQENNAYAPIGELTTFAASNNYQKAEPLSLVISNEEELYATPRGEQQPTSPRLHQISDSEHEGDYVIQSL